MKTYQLLYCENAWNKKKPWYIKEVGKCYVTDEMSEKEVTKLAMYLRQLGHNVI